MFKKILVAEDYESANISVIKTLDELGIDHIQHAFYCDDALSKIKKALTVDQEPFELLITDLNFEEDHREQLLKDGRDLTKAVREIQPDIKIIFFSVERKIEIIDQLFKNYDINGYVSKGREDTKELKKAIDVVYNDEHYLKPEFKKTEENSNSYDFSNYDITLVNLLAEGMLQKNIPEYLQKKGIKPHSLSSIEKKLSSLRDILHVANNHQLILEFKDLGLLEP